MANQNQPIGSLIVELADMLQQRKQWSMDSVMAYLAEAVSKSTPTIYKWRQDSLRPNQIQVETLLHIGLTEAGLGEAWAEALLRGFGHSDIQSLIDRYFTSVKLPKQKLPRRPYKHFRGRQHELDLIFERLEPKNRSWIIPIEGIGGIGKTCLALEVAWQFVEQTARFPIEHRFDAIVWASAKEKELTAEIVRFIPHRATSLNDIYHAIGRVLDVALNDDEKTIDYVVDKYLRAAGRVLLIVDNLETLNIVEQEKVFAFLEHVPVNVKVIITLRLLPPWPNIPHSRIAVNFMDESNMRSLIQDQLLSHDLILTKEQTNELYRLTSGIPLAVWWAVGLMAAPGSSVTQVFKKLQEPHTNLIEFIFQEVLERLQQIRPDIYYMLLLMSFFHNTAGASSDALQASLPTDSETCQSTIQILLRLNLINRTALEDHYTILAITHAYVCGQLALHQEWEHQARERWLNWYLAFAQKHGCEDVADWIQSYALIDAEWDNFREVFDWCREHDRYDEMVSLWRDFGLTRFTDLNRNGTCWSDLLENLKWLVHHASLQDHPDIATLVWALIVQARIHLLMGSQRDIERAGELLDQAYVLREHTNPNLQMRYAEVKAFYLGRNQRFEDALQVLETSVPLMQELSPSDAIRRWGDYLHRKGTTLYRLGPERRNEARAVFEEARDFGEKHQRSRVQNAAFSGLADIAIDDGDYSGAEYYLSAAEEIARKNMDTRRMAAYYRSQARLGARRGQWTAANEYAQKAMEQYRCLNMSIDFAEMETLLHNIDEQTL